MTVSQNGWAAAEDYMGQAAIGVRPFAVLPGSHEHVSLNEDAAPVLLYVAARWNDDVERVVTDNRIDEWGFAPRNVRGSTTEISNHASGTALDINAAKHPRGKRTLSRRRRRKVHAILADVNAGQHVLDWGGDYQHSPVDEMHVEIARRVSKADLREVMARLEGTPLPHASPPTLWMHGPHRPHWTRVAQRHLGVKVDGVFGKHTRAAVRRCRRNNKIRPYRHGVIGPKVWRAMGVTR